MPDYENIAVDRVGTDGRVGRVTLDRPEKMNALSQDAKDLAYTGDSISGTEAERIGIINYALLKEELDGRTIASADRIANMMADHLAMLKLNTNRFYVNMGIYSSVRSSTDHDTAAQFTQ